MTALIKLTSAGDLIGPFNIYSDVGGYISAFAQGIQTSQLLAGYATDKVPAGTSTVRLRSVGVCTNYIDISFLDITTTTTTSSSSTTTTTSSSSTTTTTTTRLPDVCKLVVSFEYRGAPGATLFADYLLCGDETATTHVFSGLTPDPVAWTTYNMSTAFPSGLCVLDGSFDRISGCEIQNVIYSADPCTPHVLDCTLVGTAIEQPTTTTTTTLPPLDFTLELVGAEERLWAINPTGGAGGYLFSNWYANTAQGAIDYGFGLIAPVDYDRPINGTWYVALQDANGTIVTKSVTLEPQ
jgi:hypothetical protein